jgi:hypothetical protein
LTTRTWFHERTARDGNERHQERRHEGFAIPTWRRRHGIVATGVFVGIWWSAWHLLPNIWSSRAAAGELAMSVHLTATAIGVLVGYLTAFRVLMVWVYGRTESLLVAMLMHASFTQPADPESAGNCRSAPRDLFLHARRRGVGRCCGDRSIHQQPALTTTAAEASGVRGE